MLQILRSSTPSAEKDLASQIKHEGGTDAVIANENTLRILLDEQNKLEARNRAESSADEDVRGLDTTTDKRSIYTVHHLKKELQEDWDTAVKKNLEAFAGKFAIQQRQMQEDMDNAVSRGVDRMINALNQGPHELINNEVIGSRSASSTHTEKIMFV